MDRRSSPRKFKFDKSSCLLGCDSEQRLNTVERDKLLVDSLRNYSHEPMFHIFSKHDRDKDNFLKKGEVIDALKEAGITVVDEELAFEWLDRYFENKLSYK